MGHIMVTGETSWTAGAGNASKGKSGPASEASASVAVRLRKARIFVAEDHLFVRQAMVSLINNQPDLVCCGEDDNIASTPANLARRKPDLLLLDLRLKDGEALPLITALRFRYPDLYILVLSQCDETVYAEKVLRAGANGYLMKQEAAEEVLNAMRVVLRGKQYLSRAMDRHLFHHPIWPVLPSGKSLGQAAASEGKISPGDKPPPMD
jgi:DNA-binding NarL/FixJ family response regulator